MKKDLEKKGGGRWGGSEMLRHLLQISKLFNWKLNEKVIGRCCYIFCEPADFLWAG